MTSRAPSQISPDRAVPFAARPGRPSRSVQSPRAPLVVLCLATAVLAAGCASTRIVKTGALSSYDGMTPVHSMRTKALVRFDPVTLMAARTLRIEPVVHAQRAGEPALSEAQRELIANALERTMCSSLSERFDIVGPGTPANLDLKVTITRFGRSSGGVAAASVAASAFSPSPVTPRIPIGLGSLSAEGEVTDSGGRQVAAMVWTRGADMFTSRPRLSRIGDAYELSGAFARDMATLLVAARNPLQRAPAPTAAERARPVSPACAAYGKGGGVPGFIEGMMGAPPEWTDGRRPSQPLR